MQRMIGFFRPYVTWFLSLVAPKLNFERRQAEYDTKVSAGDRAIVPANPRVVNAIQPTSVVFLEGTS